MRKVITRAGALAVVIAGTVLLAPGAWAMLPPEPGGFPVPASSTPPSGGVAVWQLAAVAIVAVVIGAVGSLLAQRTRRDSQPSASMPIHA
jgi:hypothetical protein